MMKNIVCVLTDRPLAGADYVKKIGGKRNGKPRYKSVFFDKEIAFQFKDTDEHEENIEINRRRL